MTTYRVIMTSGDEWFMSGDFAQSASPLKACFDEESLVRDYCQDVTWQGVPYQVADAGLSQYDAAKLVYDYFDDDDDKIEEVSQLL